MSGAKRKVSQSSSGDSDGGGSAKKAKTPSDSLHTLGGMKKVSVSEFKGKKYVNIREYYVDKASGEEKPGSKGIALNKDQWEGLKKLVSVLDECFNDDDSEA